MSRIFFIAVVTSLSLQGVALAAQMTPQQQQDTGVYKLTPAEKQALNQWIEDNHYPKSSVNSLSPSSENVPSLSQNIRNGQYIQLSDDSLWEINSEDLAITQGWISPVPIDVEKSGDANFPALLVNSLTGSKVRARQIDKIPAASSLPANRPVNQ